MYAYPTMPSQTEKGVRNVSITIVIFLVVELLLVGLLAALAPIIAFVTIGGPPDPGLLAAALTFLAFVCVLLIVYVVGLIFGLIGLIALHKGRDEFGPAHAQKIDRGIIVLILGIFLPLVVGAIGSTEDIGGGAVGLTPRTTVISAAAGLASGVLGSLLVGLFLLWSVEALTTPVLRMRAMIALVLGIAAGAAGGVASIVILSTTTVQTGNFVVFLIPGILSAGISVISLGLWFMTYRGVLERFKRGELRAAPPVMYPPMYMPPQYPQYGVPYPPPAPPPQQPPPGAPPP